jgi:hypothetical protein
MYVLLTDESNLEPSESIKFFTYGGLIVPLVNLPALHDRIGQIRTKAGYQSTDRLKFETKSRPRSVSLEAATEAKRAVVAAAIELDCKFIAYVVLHAIAKANDIQTNIQFGANSVIGKFNTYLGEQKSHGIVAMDRLPKGTEFEYLAEKFTKGLALPKGEAQELDRVVMFSSTCINASHLSSAMDIVLGTWRYCINQPLNAGAAKDMMAQLAKLIWHVPMGEDIMAHERGLLFRPKEVKHAPYKADYDALLKHLNTLLEGKA